MEKNKNRYKEGDVVRHITTGHLYQIAEIREEFCMLRRLLGELKMDYWTIPYFGNLNTDETYEKTEK